MATYELHKKLANSVSLDTQIIVANAALNHIEWRRNDIENIMSHVNLKPDLDYILQAGFNETMIRRNVGHLEEIYVQVNTTIPSHILKSLGKTFSPFPGVVLMPTGSQRTPVFNDTGAECDQDTIFLSGTARFHKDALLLFNQKASAQSTRHGADESNADSSGSFCREESSGVGQSSSNGGRFPLDHGQLPSSRQLPLDASQTSSDDGHISTGGRQDENQSHTLSGSRQSPSVVPFDGNKELSPSPPDLGEETLPEAYFNVTARMKLTEGEDLYSLQMTGALTSVLMQRTASVQFKELRFQGDSYVSDTAELHFIRVSIDAEDKGARIRLVKPEATRYADGKTVRTEGKGKHKAREFASEFVASLSPSGRLGDKRTSGTKTHQTTENSERITVSQRLGVAWWGFTVRDSFMRTGCSLPDKHHPEASFEFEPDTIPSEMQVQVVSYWFAPNVHVQNDESKSDRLKSLLRRWTYAKQVMQSPSPYYNFCHAVNIYIPPSLSFKQVCNEKVVFNINNNGVGNTKRRDRDCQGRAQAVLRSSSLACKG